MSIKAIVFDLDGTIADTIPLTVYSLREVTRSFTGKEYSDAEILKEFGPIDTDIIKKLVNYERSEESIEAYVKHFEDNFDGHVKPIEGIKELLQFIKSKGIKIGLFTGRSLRVTEIILKKINCRDYFDVLMAGDFTAKPKPDPEGIIKALEQLDVDNHNSVYVGDFDVDIMASRAAGTKSVLVLWSTSASEKLIDLKPDKYFRSPYEFIEWLKSEEQ